MINTILSEKDARLIEKSILKYGRILSVANLMTLFSEEYSKASAHNRISFLSHAGWLKRIKKGTYLIIDSISSRSQIDVSLMSIANVLIADSYVSLSHALNYYQLFDQYSATVTSISQSANKIFHVDDFIFKYSKVKNDMSFGFTEKVIDGKKIRIADAEKALIDYLYLDKSFSIASLVFEIMRDHHQELDHKKLQYYATRSGLTISRKIGFLLDHLKLDSTIAYNFIEKNRGFSRFTTQSKKFNAQWRLYYDDRIIG